MTTIQESNLKILRTKLVDNFSQMHLVSFFLLPRNKSTVDIRSRVVLLYQGHNINAIKNRYQNTIELFR